MTDAPRALADVRVVDLATTRAELAGRVLADLGARGHQDRAAGRRDARRLPPFRNGADDSIEGSLYWAFVGLGKRSVVLDIASTADRDRLLALIDGADILIESFDPGVMEAVGSRLRRAGRAQSRPRLHIGHAVRPDGAESADARRSI